MTWKTILVQLNDERRAELLLGVATHLANRSNAHLVGLHVSAATVYLPPVPIPFGTDVLGSLEAGDKKEANRLREIFEAATKGGAFIPEWRAVRPAHQDIGAVVMDHGRASDLIVVGQSDPEWDLSPVLDFPERLTLESGRPVLVVPYAGRFGDIGKRVTIAWAGKRESTRAVFDALPLLKDAEAVQLLCVVGHGAKSEPGALPGAEMAATLARHGVKVTVQKSTVNEIGIADEILSRLADHASDLLVMGAYGHTRFRELVFGGVTRHIFRHMTVPTLMSH